MTERSERVGNQGGGVLDAGADYLAGITDLLTNGEATVEAEATPLPIGPREKEYLQDIFGNVDIDFTTADAPLIAKILLEMKGQSIASAHAIDYLGVYTAYFQGQSYQVIAKNVGGNATSYRINLSQAKKKIINNYPGPSAFRYFSQRLVEIPFESLAIMVAEAQNTDTPVGSNSPASDTAADENEFEVYRPIPSESITSIPPIPGDINPRAWRQDAVCAQTNPEAFFPEKGGSPREVKKACGRCAVQGFCLEYALVTGERFGVWGGKSENERRKLRRDAALRSIALKQAYEAGDRIASLQAVKVVATRSPER